MKRLVLIACVVLASCSRSPGDEVALIRGADALAWDGKHQVAGHRFRELPATLAGWNVAPAGNLTAFLPRRIFEELGDLPQNSRTPRPVGDVIINIGDARAPDVMWNALQPLEPTGEFAGLKRFVSRAPGVVAPGDTLVLPAPYRGHVQCGAGVLSSKTASCDVTLTHDGLRHSFTITVDQIQTWREYVESYLRVVSLLEA